MQTAECASVSLQGSSAGVGVAGVQQVCRRGSTGGREGWGEPDSPVWGALALRVQCGVLGAALCTVHCATPAVLAPVEGTAWLPGGSTAYVTHCTALHCTALHCTAPHCTTLHTALHTLPNVSGECIRKQEAPVHAQAGFHQRCPHQTL